MKTLVALLILTTPFTANALLESPLQEYKRNSSYTSEEAFRITTGALLEQRDISLLVKTTEAWAWKTVKSVGLKEEYVRLTATVGAPIIFGKISTRGFKMHWEPKPGLLLRPDVDYYYREGTYNYTFSVVWGF